MDGADDSDDCSLVGDVEDVCEFSNLRFLGFGGTGGFFAGGFDFEAVVEATVAVAAFVEAAFAASAASFFMSFSIFIAASIESATEITDSTS